MKEDEEERMMKQINPLQATFFSPNMIKKKKSSFTSINTPASIIRAG